MEADGAFFVVWDVFGVSHSLCTFQCSFIHHQPYMAGSVDVACCHKNTLSQRVQLTWGDGHDIGWQDVTSSEYCALSPIPLVIDLIIFRFLLLNTGSRIRQVLSGGLGIARRCIVLK